MLTSTPIGLLVHDFIHEFLNLQVRLDQPQGIRSDDLFLLRLFLSDNHHEPKRTQCPLLDDIPRIRLHTHRRRLRPTGAQRYNQAPRIQTTYDNGSEGIFVLLLPGALKSKLLIPSDIGFTMS